MKKYIFIFIVLSSYKYSVFSQSESDKYILRVLGSRVSSAIKPKNELPDNKYTYRVANGDVRSSALDVFFKYNSTKYQWVERGDCKKIYSSYTNEYHYQSYFVKLIDENLIHEYNDKYYNEYPFYPDKYNSVNKIKKQFANKIAYIYDFIGKEYVSGFWSGKVIDGFAEGEGIGFVDSYNKQTSSKYSYGTRIEGVLTKGKPNGPCDIINTTSMGVVNGMKNPFAYNRYSGIFSKGLFDGEVLTTMSEPISLGPIANVKYLLIRYSEGNQVGNGFLLNEKNEVLAEGTTKNGRLYFEDNGSSKDLNTILTIVGVTVGAAILLDKGIDYLHDYYAKHGYTGSSYGSSSSVSKNVSPPSSNNNIKVEDKHETNIKGIEFTNGKYIVTFENGNTLDATIDFKTSEDGFDVYTVNMKDDDELYSHEVYVVTKSYATLGGANTVGAWYGNMGAVLNGSYIGIKGKDDKDVVNYYVKNYYLK
jgi:hypothetical protein